ncbi:MAG: hypothetical protein U0794_18750 [Isosphaeraceae bacterium]
MSEFDDWESTLTKSDRYLYAIIDEYGKCWIVGDGKTQKVEGISSLMRRGWRPIRETPYVAQRMNSTYILICLERI